MRMHTRARTRIAKVKLRVERDCREACGRYVHQIVRENRHKRENGNPTHTINCVERMYCCCCVSALPGQSDMPTNKWMTMMVANEWGVCSQTSWIYQIFSTQKITNGNDHGAAHKQNVIKSKKKRKEKKRRKKVRHTNERTSRTTVGCCTPV